jgi:dienelactone hydrolase
LSGQEVSASQGVVGFSIGGALTVALAGQSITSAQGTPTVYSSYVAVALTGQSMPLLQGPIVKVDEGQIYNVWVEASPATSTWTPDDETTSTWTHGRR